jgi:subtilisin family serine protease
MRRGRITIGVVGLALAGLAGGLLVGTPHAGALQVPGGAAFAAYQDGNVLIGFRHVSVDERHAIEARAGASEVEALGAGGYLLHVPAGHVLRAVATLRAQPSVRYAEPDHMMQLAATPEDPSFGQQWGLQNTGQVVNGIEGTPGADINATTAWNVATDSRSVVVAELDSGVDYHHPDLAANVWTNPGGVGGCPAGTHGYNVVANTCDPLDDFGHGTQVAGVLGAVGNNGIGIAGAAWRTTILPVKWTDSTGRGSTSRLIRALDWAIGAKAAGVNVRVVNDSAVFSGTSLSQALSDELDKLAANSSLFVTAAGNNKNDNDITPKYPCSYGKANEVCVAATEQRDRLASFSNWGANTVDLAAPGKNILTTVAGGGYGYTKGTSFAAPLVAGAAALALSIQDTSTSALKARILGGVDPLPPLAGKVRTGGRLDLCKPVPGC